MTRKQAMARARCDLLGPIDPQPPHGIKYMLGDETWLPVERRTKRRLFVEEWGNLGPMELDPSIQDNGHGFRVRTTEIEAPAGALGFARVGEAYYWTTTDEYGRTADERARREGR